MEIEGTSVRSLPLPWSFGFRLDRMCETSTCQYSCVSCLYANHSSTSACIIGCAQCYIAIVAFYCVAFSSRSIL